MHRKLRKMMSAALPVILTITCIFMVWKSVCLLLNSPTPIICVVSESMAPAFHRGDILIISNRQTHIEVGDVPVVWFSGSPLPMVHRATKTWYNSSGGQELLAKGDNNIIDDVSIYPSGRASVFRREILGLVRFYVPFVGWGVIGFEDALVAIKRLTLAGQI